MKKKTSIILMIVGAVLIVFGALIPTIFKGNSSSVDRFTYDRDSGFSEYSVTVNVVSSKEYSINSITITLQDTFDEYNTKEKLVNSPAVTKKKDGNDFVYTIVITITQDEFFDYSKVSKVSMQTSIGQRTAEEKEMLSNVSWKTPVMIIVIFFGVAITMTGIAMIASIKLQSNLAEKTRKELAQSNPEIDTSNMSDAEVLAKQRELRLSKFKEDFAFGDEQKPKERICEYCGATNSAEANKCSSCGANLKTKK
ncbi:MAG: zinc ribbon domain-containing protein [Clostridia bacterium]|nr:zinc ribbon domain-containing protein [Clostridia bacterium]